MKTGKLRDIACKTVKEWCEEKTIKSPREQGEYLIYEDVGSDEAETPIVSVSFRKTICDGTPDEYDFEYWRSFLTWEGAEAAVEKEIERNMK